MNIKNIILFIEREDIEWHWFTENKNIDVVIFIHDHNLEEFRKITTASDYDDEGIDVIMKENYFCVRMNQLCEDNDIDITEVFDIKENAELIRGLV